MTTDRESFLDGIRGFREQLPVAVLQFDALLEAVIEEENRGTLTTAQEGAHFLHVAVDHLCAALQLRIKELREAN